jgi:hypothetical protein
MLWQGVALLIEWILAWLARPRVVLLIILAVVFVVVSYIAFEQPMVGLAIKKFALKTLPAWWDASAIVLARAWPKVTAVVYRAAAKKYIRGLVMFLGTFLLTQQARFWLREKKKRAVAAIKLNVVERPRSAWQGLSRKMRILVVALVILIIVSVPSLHFLGWFIFPLALLKVILNFLWSKILVKVGAGAVVGAIQSRIIRILSWLMPDSVKTYRWRLKKNLVLRRRAVQERTARLALLRERFKNRNKKKPLYIPPKTRYAESQEDCD